MAKNDNVHCAHTKMVPIDELQPNPKNPNKHPAGQLELLRKIIEAQGWRAPITVSNRSGMVVKGHARLEAGKMMGATKVPVDYQDYASEQDEMADLLADNRLAELAEIDRAELADLLNDDELFADFDLELAGFDADAIAALDDGFDVVDDADPDPFNDSARVPVHGYIIGIHNFILTDKDEGRRDQIVDIVGRLRELNPDSDLTAEICIKIMGALDEILSAHGK